jgi:hypothetical protein
MIRATDVIRAAVAPLTELSILLPLLMFRALLPAAERTGNAELVEVLKRG